MSNIDRINLMVAVVAIIVLLTIFAGNKIKQDTRVANSLERIALSAEAK